MTEGSEPSREELLSVFESFAAAYNEHGREAFLARTTEDVVLTTAPEWPGGGTFSGRAEVGRFLTQFEEAWEEIRFEYENPRVVRRRIVTSACWVARGSASGAETRLDFWSIARFEGDHIAELTVFFTEAEALELAEALEAK